MYTDQKGERHFRVYNEAPGFLPAPRERETIPRVQGGTRPGPRFSSVHGPASMPGVVRRMVSAPSSSYSFGYAAAQGRARRACPFPFPW